MVFAIKFDSPDEAAEEEYALRDGWGSEINTAVSGDTVYVEGGDLAKKVVHDWYPDNKTELVDPPEDIAKMLHGADEANAAKSYVLAHKGPNDTTYCKNKAGDWTTHIEDAWEGSGPDSFSAEMKRNFADAVHCDVEDLEVIPVEKFESKGANETIEYEKGYKNSRGEDAPWVIRDHKNGKVLASFSKKDDAEAHLERMKHYSKGEKLFNKQELESMAMNGYKAAVTAAWSGAGVKNFKIDIRINEEEPPTLDVRPKTLDGKDIDVSWRLLPNVMKIAQYSISPVGNHTIEREMDFTTEDDVEGIFTDEFKSLDDVLEHGKTSESTNDLRGFYLKVWHGLVSDYKMSGEAADALCAKYQDEIVDGYENGEGPAKICDALAAKNKAQEGTDGFTHLWELQAQQAKETLEELTKKFGDADRLAFEIRNIPTAKECDVVVTVDGNPFITAEFKGGRHSGIRWHCFEDDVTAVHLNAGDDDAAKNMILAFKDEILDALTSLYGFSAAADEGGQSQEPQELAATPKQETDQWCVEFGDIYSNVEKEYYTTEDDAKARYTELAERGDIEWVEDPTLVPAAKEEKVSYDDYAESVKAILMGREFEYGPETANQFVVDDYKDIVRKNYDAGKGAVAAAADIDAAYMGKE